MSRKRPKEKRSAPLAPVSAEGPQPQWREHVSQVWPYVALAVLAFSLYARCLGYGFVSDDHGLENNPRISDLRHIPGFFLEDQWGKDKQGRAGSSFYRPLQTTTFTLIYVFAGPNPMWFHLVWLLFHVVNTLLVYWLTQRLLAPVCESRWAALTAAILFAVHPIHIEAVPFCVPDTIMLWVPLCMLGMFVRQQGRPTTRQAIGHALLYFVSMLGKEIGIVMLPMFVAYEWICLKRGVREIVMRGKVYACMLAALAFYFFVRLRALGSFSPHQGGSGMNLHGIALLYNMTILMRTHLQKLFLPTHMAFFHPFYPSRTITTWGVISVVTVLVVFLSVPLLRKRSPLFAFGICCIVLPLLPVMNINGINSNAFAERYLYMPSVGFCWIMALAWERLREKSKGWAAGTLIVVSAISIGILENRLPVWKNDTELLGEASREHPEAPNLTFGHAGHLAREGRIAEAIPEFRKGLAATPGNNSMRLDLALLLRQNGRIQEAIPEYRELIERGAVDADILPDFLNDLGQMEITIKDYPAALKHLRRSLTLKPGSFKAETNLGGAYVAVGDYAAAVEPLRKAIQHGAQDPDVAYAHYLLGVALQHLGQSQEAAQEFSKAHAMNANLMAVE